ncbi:MAG TPA: hypothetical protein PKO09_13180 [Anaerolineae bacterium]|nr:hypothetical protein [Anaerolineae bacterium]
MGADETAPRHAFDDRTSDQQVLEFTPDPPAQNVRLVRVVTTLSPSWVSWREIELLGP